MRVDQFSTTGLTSASPGGTASDGAVLMPYNAPSTGDFTQVMNSVSQNPQTPQTTQTTPQQQPQSGQSGTSAGTSSADSPSVPSSTTVPTPSLPFMPLSPGTAGTTGATGTTGTPDFPDTRAGMMEAAAYGFALALAQSPSSGSGATTAADSLRSLFGGTSPASTAALSATGASGASATGATFALPFHGSPTITQPFGPTSYTAEPAYDGYSHFHTGIDFGVPLGTSVLAAAGGKVVSAGWDTTGFGNKVVIDHGNGLQTLYGHLEQIDVKPGDVVQAGQEIGLSGSTGNSSGPHLHFGVEKDGQWVNPAPYLSGTSGTASAASTPGTPTSSDSATTDTTASMATTAATSTSVATPASGDDNSIPALIARASAATGVDRNLISAVVQAESAGDPRAVSQAGAKGLMQLMDSTAAGYGVTNPFDPAQNVMAGARYLHDLLDRFHGDKTLAVAAYNAGPGAVEQYGGVPPYPETQQYVQRVLGLQQQYATSAANGATSTTTGASA